MNDLSGFVRWAESEITRVTNGKTFLPRALRDRYRVYSLARLLGIIETGAQVEEMLLVAPGLYEGLLRAYSSLLRQRANQLYWQRLEEAADPNWPSHVKNALSEVAQRLGVDARSLAHELDAGEYPWTRNLVILISQRNLLGCP